MIPFPVILSSPSGAGKTSLARRLLELRRDVGYSISATTRSPREGEKDGRDYFFLTRDSFKAAQSEGAFAESAEVHGQLYGTLKTEVDRVLGAGKHVIMDIDVQGTRQFISVFPQSVLIFILPPSAEVLLTRLKGRGSEDPVRLKRRLESAVEELKAVREYHYVVVNDDLDRAAGDVSAILDGEDSKISRLGDLDSVVAGIAKGISDELEIISKRKT